MNKVYRFFNQILSDFLSQSRSKMGGHCIIIYCLYVWNIFIKILLRLRIWVGINEVKVDTDVYGPESVPQCKFFKVLMVHGLTVVYAKEVQRVLFYFTMRCKPTG